MYEEDCETRDADVNVEDWMIQNLWICSLGVKNVVKPESFKEYFDREMNLH